MTGAALPSEPEDARERYIRALVERAPPLSDEQRHRLALALGPVAARLSVSKRGDQSKRSA